MFSWMSITGVEGIATLTSHQILEDFVTLSHGVPDVEDVEGLGMQNGRVVLGSWTCNHGTLD
jgi:hypothetical protein